MPDAPREHTPASRVQTRIDGPGGPTHHAIISLSLMSSPRRPNPSAPSPAGSSAPEADAPARRERSVTFVIPCYNHGKFVADAVRSCLAQEQTDARVVIVDDGSNDGTTPRACDQCRDLPGWVEVIHQPNTGLPGARNVGAARAMVHESEFLVFLDADDYLEPAFVRALAGAMDAAFAADPAARTLGPGAVSHAYCQERLTDKAFGTWAVPAWDPILLLITNLHPVTALIRRECFEALAAETRRPARAGLDQAPADCPGFDASMRKGYEDWDLWLRMSARGWRGVRVREPLFNWRRHSDTTMVMESVRHHDELFRFLMAKHKALYEKHAGEIIARSNLLLRKADANWLDENLDAIFVRDLRARNIELFGELERARKEADSLRRECEDVRAGAQREAARLASMYENKPALKWSRRFHDAVDALPAPVASFVRKVLRAVKGS